MPLEVIGAGFGRTGTMSLQAALEILYAPEGKHCYHYGSTLTRPQHTKFWIKLLSGETSPDNADWEALFGPENFVATMDHPCANYYGVMRATYPDAKVILSKHPGGREIWYKSKLSHMQILECLRRWPLKPLQLPATRLMLFSLAPSKKEFFMEAKFVSHKDMKKLARLNEIACWGAAGIYDRDNVMSRYDEWYSKVPAVVPKDQLLEYDVSMGWEPLCKFLGKEIPDVPFPKETNHSSKEIKKSVRILETCAWIAYTVVAAITIFALARTTPTVISR
jgi:hypothetical protein